MVASRPIRVVWLIKELAVGGAERLLLELQDELGSEFEFHPVAVSAGNRSLEAAFQSAGFHPETLDARSNLDPRWMRRFRKSVKSVDPHVVHLHNPLPGAGGRAATVGLRVPLVYTEHSVWSSHHTLSRWANAVTLWRSDCVIAVSDAVRDSILSSPLGRTVRDRLVVIPNGIDAEAVRREAERIEASVPSLSPGPSYGAVGHLRFSKGIDILLHAAALIRTDIPTAWGYVVGTGEDAIDLSDLNGELGSPVKLLGLRSDARSIMGRLDVFVIPSRFEGLPLALLEAMALERPIVATKVGGIPSVLTDGVNALLVPAENPNALAGGIVRLLRDQDLARRLGREARATVETRFSIRETARRYADTYGWVLEKHASRA